MAVSARQHVPRELSAVAAESEHCRRCDLWRHASQTVFGAGEAPAAIMMVGEQPGDQEDLVGEPFVGPAGGILDRALEEAGLARKSLYVTNAVKHFKFERRGKRRLHKRPTNAEVDICRWWLGQELELVHPSLAIALGVSALRGLMGKSMTLGSVRGQVLHSPEGVRVFPTIHPSAILRQRGNEARDQAFQDFVADLVQAKRLVN
jgi:uracil-DNA glycosylase family protein